MVAKARIMMMIISFVAIAFGAFQIKREDRDFMTQILGVIYIFCGFILFLLCLAVPTC